MFFEAITTKEQADALDSDLLIAGYRAGWRDQPDYTQREQAYWHGYLNGQVDSGKMIAADTQLELARDVVAKSRAN